MYSGFIEEQLANTSYYMKLIKRGLDLFHQDWIPADFYSLLPLEPFELINNFLVNSRTILDEAERLFISKATYSAAGFKESLIQLGDFLDDTKINVAEDEVSPYQYTITVITTSESFYDMDLMKHQLDELVKELLYYYVEPTATYILTFEINAVNEEHIEVHANPRIFKFYELSGTPSDSGSFGVIYHLDDGIT